MEVVLREIINREKSKNSWKKIKRALDKSDYSSLTKLIIPIAEGEEQTITKAEEIHEAIINYNIKHYSKPEASPFGLGTFLCEAIGPHGTTDFADRILAGELNPEDEKEIKFQEAFELLKLMKNQDQPPTQREPKKWKIDSIQALLNRETKNAEETKEETTEEAERETIKEGKILISLEITA